MDRADQIHAVTPDERDRWLAGEIDNLERLLVEKLGGLAGDVKDLTAELHVTREEMSHNTSRIVWTVATASVTLLLSVVGGVILAALSAR